jgi:hypothetical protein
MTKTLVQRTNTATEQDFVKVHCGDCSADLFIPIEIYRKLEHSREGPEVAPLLGKQYDGFYVSPERHLLCGSNGYFCNEACNKIFTET